MELAAIRDEFRYNFEAYALACLKIKDKVSARLVPFRFNDAQRILLADRAAQLKERGYVRQIDLKGRQQGISTVVEGIGIHKVTNFQGISAYILTHEGAATDTIFDMVKLYHNNLPAQVRPRLTSDSGKKLTYGGLGSGYRVGTAGAIAGGRSQNLQFFHGSEVAFWPNAADHAAGVMNAVLDQGPGTEMYLESTAKGVGNYFHTQWQMAVQGEGEFRPVFVPWFLQGEYRTASLPEGWVRTDEEDDMCANFGLVDTQLAWRRNKISASAVAGIDGSTVFKQEYPCYPEEAFQHTGELGLILPKNVVKARKMVNVSMVGPVIMGIDPSLGGDAFSIAVRQGRVVKSVKSKRGQDVEKLSGRLNFCMREIEEHQPDYIFVDGGYGADLVELLRERTRAQIRIVWFGGEAIKKNFYLNKRAEMYGELNDWLTTEGQPVVLPDSDKLQGQLCASLYDTNSHGQIFLLPKKKIKKQMSVELDESDALALTFAEPVVNFTFGRGTKKARIVGNV